MHNVYIGIGSNLGDRKKNCRRAIEQILTRNITNIVIVSKWYETEPLTDPDQPVPDPKPPRYMNGVVRIETDLPPVKLLRALQKIEAELGRVRTDKKWESRTIDIDILLYDNLVMKTPELTIPHPELHKRRFVLDPLCDIAPDLIHPILGRSIASLKRELIGAEAGSVK